MAGGRRVHLGLLAIGIAAALRMSRWRDENETPELYAGRKAQSLAHILGP